MHQIDVPKLIAGCCALAGFAIAIVAGLAAENTLEAIITRALVSMAGCYFLGMLIGAAAEAAIRESADPVAEAAQGAHPSERGGSPVQK